MGRSDGVLPRDGLVGDAGRFAAGTDVDGACNLGGARSVTFCGFRIDDGTGRAGFLADCEP